jgi:hypothetical protein
MALARQILGNEFPLTRRSRNAHEIRAAILGRDIVRVVLVAMTRSSVFAERVGSKASLS